LRGGLGFDFNPPLRREDGKLIHRPAFEMLAIGFRWRGLNQMADAPSHGDARASKATLAALRGTEDAPDVLTLRGLFAQIKPHVAPSESCCRNSSAAGSPGEGHASAKKVNGRQTAL
jgi:hypothetical protein